MMITARIFATGPSIDWRICWSGCSHGMDEPDACAAGAKTIDKRVTDAAVAM
jgi:hypothetical protein